MGVRVLTDAAQEKLREIPGWAQNAPEHKALAQVYANESERQRELAERIRDGMIPILANDLTLPWWETLLKMTVNPPGLSEEDRRALVLARLRQAPPDPSGITWQERVTGFLGPAWSYVEEEPQTIRATVPWAPGSSEFMLAKRILREQIPAAWELIVQSVEGFILDSSELDQEPFHSK